MIGLARAALLRRPRSSRSSARVVAWMACGAATFVLAPRSAAADAPADSALAEALFLKGKELMAAGDYAAACPKLAESQRLDPGGGTLLALGLCHEGEGRTATAWAELSEARAIARKESHAQREAVAAEHLARLSPRLSRVTVMVPSAVSGTQGLTVLLDDEPLRPPAWGMAVPVDPGPHVVTASAPGKLSFSLRFEVGVTADARTVEIRPLAGGNQAGPPLTEPAAAPRPSGPPGGLLRPFGIAIGAIGLAAIGVGGYFGVRAIGDNNASRMLCPSAAPTCANSEGVRLSQDTRSEAAASTGLIIGGLAALGAGVAMVVVSTKSGPPQGKITFAVRPGMALISAVVSP
jgi:hypothetical protein